MSQSKKNTLKGATLIELLVAIIVVGILIFSSTLVVSTQIKKAKDGKRKADLQEIKIALYDYYFDANCFPETLPNCGEDFASDGTVHLANFPCDPDNNRYGYQAAEEDCSQWFKILANLENNRDSAIDKTGCRNGCGPECEYNYGLASTNILVNKDCVIYYACAPGGDCAEFEDPFISQCPRVFENDPSCANSCEEKENRCRDARGKRIPEE